MPHLWQLHGQGCTNFPKIWVAPQHFSVFQKADMKFLTRGPTDIRRCTDSSRRGELAPGILAVLVKGAYTLELGAKRLVSDAVVEHRLLRGN